MARALDHLLQLSNNLENTQWLISDRSLDFPSLARSYYQELTPFIEQNITPKILINDAEPVRFLAKFLATTAAELPIFLGNHQWGIQEWQQVEKLVQPNFIWNDQLSPTNNIILDHQPRWIMIPTGGSSGKVKFAIHTWQTLSASVAGLQEYFQLAVINSFCVLPVYHVSGLMQFMRSLLTGGQLVITNTKHLENSLDFPIYPEEFFISLVPTQLQKLLANSQTRVWLSQFQAVFLGGGAAWQELLNEARKLQIPLAMSYGMTETASQIVTLKPQDFLAGNNSCGQLLPHAHISLTPPEVSKVSLFKENLGGSIISEVPLFKRDLRGSIMSEVPLFKEDLEGLITIKSTSLALGYYPESWANNTLTTDDLGFFDRQGYLSIAGRQSLQIITGGEKVFPPEVEAIILATKLVQDVCVLGLPDAYWGEVVAAFYVPANLEINSPVNQEIIQEAIAPHLAKYKHPKLWFPVAELPRNAQGKINYQILRSTRIPRD